MSDGNLIRYDDMEDQCGHCIDDNPEMHSHLDVPPKYGLM